MGSVMNLIMADKQLIGIIPPGPAAKVPRPGQFGSAALDILEIELRSTVDMSIGSDIMVPVVWPADTPFFIKVRRVCAKASPEIADTWVMAAAVISVIAHVRTSAYADLN